MSRFSHHRRLQLLVLLGAAPMLGLAAWACLAPRIYGPLWLRLGLLGVAVVALLAALRELRVRSEHPLQTLSNLVAALREGDYSFRARAREKVDDDALDSVFRELNGLSELLQQQRLKATEATALLTAVISEIDVAVFAFDEGDVLRLVNRAGEALLGRPSERMQPRSGSLRTDGLLGASARSLGLSEALEGEDVRLVDLSLPGRAGRFEVRRTAIRQGGFPHTMLVLSDLTRTLREEERRAWQRLVRVLGHEINNSLAPIQSLSGSIERIIERREEDWMEDARQGLSIIASRAQALGRFMDAYTRLARLPDPRKAPLDAGMLVRKASALETRLGVRVLPGPELRLEADADQLEQALINLVRNAVDAVQETGGGVSLTWREDGAWGEFVIEDEGPGLPKGGNLFVPFFTTKPGGSGIGLLLARQVAEGHGGTLMLANRETQGVRAVLRIPKG